MRAEAFQSSVRGVLREDYVRNGARLSSRAFHALVMYRFGVWRDALPPSPVRKLLRLPYVFLHRHVRWRDQIELHYTATLGRRVRLAQSGGLTIGNRVVVGDDCLLGPGVTLGRTVKGWPTIGRGVVLAPGATVIGDITIGDGAVLGPNVVVIADVPPGATVEVRPSELRVGPTPSRSGTGVDPSLRRVRRRDVPPGSSVGPGVLITRCGNAAVDGRVAIGANCVLREGISIGWSAEGEDGDAPLTRIGDSVDLGAGCVVLSGVTVGNNVRIEPNAVVTADVPPGATVEAAAARVFGALHRPS